MMMITEVVGIGTRRFGGGGCYCFVFELVFRLRGKGQGGKEERREGGKGDIYFRIREEALLLRIRKIIRLSYNTQV